MPTHSSVARFLTLGLAAVALAAAPAAEPAMIAKARAYIASEEVLNGLKSVHFVGTLSAPDPADPAKTVTMTMDIVFQRPM